jgi:tetratricopeptide (TPR) repeat protein
VLAFITAVLAVLFATSIQVRSDVVELYRGERALDHHDPSAIVHIQEFVSRNPGNAVGHGDLGTAYEQLSRYQDAGIEYRRALEIEPDNSAGKYDLARMYTLNRPQDAIPLYRESLPHLPQSSDKYFNFATALRMTGNLQEAELMASKAVTLDPKSARNHQLLAIVLFQLGKVDQAVSETKLADQLRSPH